MKLDREQFISDLQALVKSGVKFRHLGRSPETGMDCVFTPRWAIEKQGLPFPEELDREMEVYSDQPDGWKMKALLQKWLIEIPCDGQVPDEAMPGDILLFYVFRNPKHMGIVSSKEPLTVIEAWQSLDKKVGELREQPLDWRRRVAACFRIPDFDSQT